MVAVSTNRTLWRLLVTCRGLEEDVASPCAEELDEELEGGVSGGEGRAVELMGRSELACDCEKRMSEVDGLLRGAGEMG